MNASCRCVLLSLGLGEGWGMTVSNGQENSTLTFLVKGSTLHSARITLCLTPRVCEPLLLVAGVRGVFPAARAAPRHALERGQTVVSRQ